MIDKPQVEVRQVTDADAGQRVDNYLIKTMKGVPKTRLYRAVRSGEVRVNGARVKVSRALCSGDKLRIPPLRRSASAPPRVPPSLAQKITVLLEDDDLLIVDKPAGLAAHAGSGVAFGVIEALRGSRDDSFLELAHRLDRDTSGCLMLAKSRAALRAVQAQLAAREVEKNYTALLKGALTTAATVTTPVGDERDAHSIFTPRWTAASPSASSSSPSSPSPGSPSSPSPSPDSFNCTLTDIRLITGRMHQARIHAAAVGHPIAGDRRHGDRDFNRALKAAGLTRLFLHARRLRFTHPDGGVVEVSAPLPAALAAVVGRLRGDLADDGGV